MYVALSGFTHDDDNNAVVERYTVEPVRDDRGIWRTTMKTMYLRGLIKGSSQSAIKTELDALQDAYSGDNFDIALYHDDATRSHYYLTSADSLGGVKVVVRDFPDLGQPCQYGSGVDYRIVVQAEYPANQLSPMVFRESVEYLGNCGPDYSWTFPRTGVPYRILEQQQTLQYIKQEGYSLGLTGYPLFADPLLPALEEKRLRRIQYIGPKAAGANLRFIHWGVKWEYSFVSPTPQIIFPNTR